MLFDIKSAFFLGLLATAHASPISLDNTNVELESRSLEARAAVEPINCGGKVFTESQINASIKQAKSMMNQNKSYPAHFVNKKGSGKQKHFPAGGPEGLEYPIKANGDIWTTGMPGKYRVVGTKNFKKFMEMTMHIGNVNSGRIEACRAVADLHREEEQKRKEQEEKSKKQSEEAKKKNEEKKKEEEEKKEEEKKEEEEEKKEEEKKKKKQESSNCKRSKKHHKGGCK